MAGLVAPAATLADMMTPLDRIDAIIGSSDRWLSDHAAALADELLAIGEGTLQSWLAARGEKPTDGAVEGFRLLALHRQGSRGEPSFNACRETCRELVYLHNCIRLMPDPADAPRRVRHGAMVARHLVLFVDGKLETAGLGEFCCSSRPLRLDDAASAVSGDR